MIVQSKHTARWLALGAGLFFTGFAQAQNADPAPAYAVQAQVLQTIPVLVRERVPYEECTAMPQQGQQCRTLYRVHERVQSYEVTYLYQGQQHTTQMAYDPGATVQILPPQTQGHYSSQLDAENATVQPARKSYGSAPPTGSTHSIEYRSPQPDIPVGIDLHAPLHTQPHRPHHPQRPGQAVPPGQRPMPPVAHPLPRPTGQ